MKFDNYLLPVDELGNTDRACEKTGLLYILYKLNKDIVDEAFNKAHPPRARLEDEPFEEYDSYLTAHLQAYEQYLIKQDKGYLLNAAENFADKLTTLSQPFGLKKHPKHIHDPLDVMSIFYMTMACQMYDFNCPVKKLPKELEELFDRRTSKLNTLLSDIAILCDVFSVLYQTKRNRHLIPDEPLLLKFILTERTSTAITKAAKWLYMKYRPESNKIRIESSNIVGAIEWKYRPVELDGRESPSWFKLWEPVLLKYFT